MTVNDKFQKSGLEPEDEEDDEQQQTIGIQQLLDSKELKKKNVAPSISRTTSATAIPKPFGYDPHGRGAELVQRNYKRMTFQLFSNTYDHIAEEIQIL